MVKLRVAADFARSMPSNQQGLRPLADGNFEQIQANDTANDPLSAWIADAGENTCLMWYPNERILVPVTQLTLAEQNARMLEVEFKKPSFVFPQGTESPTTKGGAFSAEQLRKLQAIKERFSHEYFTSEKYAGKDRPPVTVESMTNVSNRS